MKKQLVFIDDSGDPSLHASSSQHFVIACALFMDDTIASLVASTIREYRRSKGWGNKSEFKFRMTRKNVIKEHARDTLPRPSLKIEAYKIRVKRRSQMHANSLIS